MLIYSIHRDFRDPFHKERFFFLGSRKAMVRLTEATGLGPQTNLREELIALREWTDASCEEKSEGAVDNQQLR